MKKSFLFYFESKLYNKIPISIPRGKAFEKKAYESFFLDFLIDFFYFSDIFVDFFQQSVRDFFSALPLETYEILLLY